MSETRLDRAAREAAGQAAGAYVTLVWNSEETFTATVALLEASLTEAIRAALEKLLREAAADAGNTLGWTWPSAQVRHWLLSWAGLEGE
jgi:hypothetical protein